MIYSVLRNSIRAAVSRERRERKMVSILLLLLAYHHSLDLNKNNLFCATHLSSSSCGQRKERESWYLFCLYYRRTDTTRVQTRTIACVLRNSVRGSSRKQRKRIGIYIFLLLPAYRYQGCKLFFTFSLKQRQTQWKSSKK